MPEKVRRMLDEVPLHVEDAPPSWLRHELGIGHPLGLLGCFSGVPLDGILRRSGNGLPTMITLYRGGLIAASRDREGRLDKEILLEQIRTTILHELGHYHGMTESDLETLGY